MKNTTKKRRKIKIFGTKIKWQIRKKQLTSKQLVAAEKTLMNAGNFDLVSSDGSIISHVYGQVDMELEVYVKIGLALLGHIKQLGKDK